MKIETISLDDYAMEVSRALTLKFLREVEEASLPVGIEFVNDIALAFVAQFVGAIVYKVLMEKREGTKKEIKDQTMDEFASIKFGVQDSVALAFQGAMSTFANTNMEYYCKINLVPPTKNKLHC